jgi:hypothetical protein
MDEDTKPFGASAKSAKKSSRRRLRGALLGLVMVAALSAAGVVALRASDGAAKIPPEIRLAQNAVTFPLYLPEELPKGFSLDAGSVSVGAQVVLYGYRYDKHKRVSISVQKRDDSFTTDQFRPTSEFTTHIGRVYLVDLEDRTTAAVVGKESWALINAPDRMAVDTMREFINSLRPVRQ